jgi:outer membrane protein
MRPLSIAAAICATLAGALPALAQTNTVRTLTLDECLQMALTNNFTIRIQQKNPAILEYSLEGAYGSYEPTLNANYTWGERSDPTGKDANGVPYPPQEGSYNGGNVGLAGTLPYGLGYSLGGNLNRNIGPGNINSAASITLTQPLLRGFLENTPKFTIEVAKRNLQSSEEGFTYQVMTVMTSVESTFYDLLYARENLEVQRQALQLAEKLLAENKKRVEVGALAPLDEKQAESAASARRSDLIAATFNLRTIQNSLVDLMSGDFRSWTEVEVVPNATLQAIPEVVNRVESWHTALENRPDLKQLRTGLEIDLLNERFRKNQTLPSLGIQGNYGQTARGDRNWSDSLNTTADGTYPNHSIGAIFSMPLGNRAARSSYRVIREQRVQDELQIQQKEQSIFVEIDNSISAISSAYELVGSTKLAREFGEAALDAEQKKLENGKSTSFFVLQLQRDLTSARSAEINALTVYNKALNSLAYHEGRTLERRNIELKIR